MTLKEAIKSSLTILKQVMEEKLNATNIEVSHFSNLTDQYVAVVLLLMNSKLATDGVNLSTFVFIVNNLV